MTFFSANLFAGGGYARAKRGAALVRGADATAEEAAEAMRHRLDECDAVLVGAGAGLSAAAGFSYSGKRFDENFADFRDRFGITDMYSGGFHPFPDLETYWAWWSRAILLNRYEAGVGKPYLDLLRILEGRDYFVLTTNVDHQFQLAGFDKARLFYTQGDYGLFQCSRNCSGETYDNEWHVREMAGRQKDQRVPSELVPRCPRCGAPMVPNLRIDGSFCEDRGWHEAAARYRAFREAHSGDRILYLELGVGDNTPVIIKYPFWNAVVQNGRAAYTCVNIGGACAPAEIAGRSILVDDDIDGFLQNALVWAADPGSRRTRYSSR